LPDRASFLQWKGVATQQFHSLNYNLSVAIPEIWVSMNAFLMAMIGKRLAFFSKLLDT
jgi:hypothetical protein